VNEAIAEYREAIRINKDFVEAHNNLGANLAVKGQLNEAIAEFREAIRINKDCAEAHCNLGAALKNKGQLDAAIAAYREAIRINKDFAEAHNKLGHAYLCQGRLAEALAAGKRGHELGSKDPGWRCPSAAWVREAELLVSIEATLPKFLSGEVKPTNVDECLALARYCQEHKKLYRTAHRFYTEAFAKQPKLAEDVQADYRYSAACAAALAGCGQGEDAEQADAAERVRLRRQALACLRADLAAWRQILNKEPANNRDSIAPRMQLWQRDTNFNGVRGPDALSKLPADERPDWQKLWQEVQALEQTAKESARKGGP
jgi:hypothetical protein